MQYLKKIILFNVVQNICSRTKHIQIYGVKQLKRVNLLMMSRLFFLLKKTTTCKI